MNKHHKVGMEFELFEYPNGCEICNLENDDHIFIRSCDDAKIIIESLNRMINIFEKRRLKNAKQN